MSWQDRLRAPSFRDINFDVEASDLSGGRRLAVHEYPQQDKPYAEDMGRAKRSIRLTGFVVGEDYFRQRDLLIGALDAPGSGTLTHPHYGDITVNVETWTVHEDVTGRIATFEMAFIETGAHEFPVSGLNAANLVDAAALEALLRAGEDLENAWSLGDVAWVTANAATYLETKVDEMRAAILGPLADLGNDLGAIELALDRIADTAATLVSTPSDLVTEMQAVLADIAAIGDAALDVFLALTGDAGAAAAVAVGDTSADDTAAGNETALDRLIRRTCLAEAARVSATVTFDSYDEAIELRDTLADRLADEGEAAEDGAVTDALSNLRGGVVDDLTTKATSLARLRSLTPTAVMPACVLAYDLYADATRGDEIVDRNRLAHPGFVPARELRVLAS